jgi:hypothetical protein
MLRLTEWLLFLVPFAAFLVWRRTTAAGGPSGAVLAAALLGLLALGAVLAWLAVNGALDRSRRYVPAQWENGRIIPGHAAP